MKPEEETTALMELIEVMMEEITLSEEINKRLMAIIKHMARLGE